MRGKHKHFKLSEHSPPENWQRVTQRANCLISSDEKFLFSLLFDFHCGLMRTRENSCFPHDVTSTATKFLFTLSDFYFRTRGVEWWKVSMFGKCLPMFTCRNFLNLSSKQTCAWILVESIKANEVIWGK